MCGGLPQLKIGDKVRKRGHEVIGEVIDIDKTNQRAFEYLVKLNNQTCLLKRSHLVKVSKRGARAGEMQLRIDIERRIDEKRMKRAEQQNIALKQFKFKPQKVWITVGEKTREPEHGCIIATDFLIDGITRYYVVEVGDGDARVIFNGDFNFVEGDA